MRKYFVWVAVALAVTLTLQTGCKNKVGKDNGEQETEVAPEPTKFGIPHKQYELVEAEVGKNETMGEILGNFGLGAGAVYRIEQASRDTFDLRKMRAGNPYTAFLQADTTGVNKLRHFVYEKNRTDYVVISLVGDSVAVYNGQKPVRIERRHARAEISSSLWNAIVGNDLPVA
ncbi:MAG: hypothetical protein LBM63_05900, partial [Rikenellaceae bacterium]|nr:hypothetical protein [Rikenellaceae bacterium]